jgi:hypothetical protein
MTPKAGVDRCPISVGAVQRGSSTRRRTRRHRTDSIFARRSATHVGRRLETRASAVVCSVVLWSRRGPGRVAGDLGNCRPRDRAPTCHPGVNDGPGAPQRISEAMQTFHRRTMPSGSRKASPEMRRASVGRQAAGRPATVPQDGGHASPALPVRRPLYLICR